MVAEALKLKDRIATNALESLDPLFVDTMTDNQFKRILGPS